MLESKFPLNKIPLVFVLKELKHKKLKEKSLLEGHMAFTAKSLF